MVIVPIGSGKGGVGKSLLATNLSIALAEAGRTVVLADLDLGASNAHTMLGIRTVSKGIGTFLSVPRTSFDQIVMPTEYDGLSFIPGDAEVPGSAMLKAAQKKRLVKCLLALEADYLVLDLGPGAGATSLDFFLLSAAGIVVTTPALTAILNAYLFIKNAVFRLMEAGVEKDSRALQVLGELRREPGGLSHASVPRIMERIAAEDRVSHERLAAMIGRLRPRLVLNMLEDPADADKVEKLRRSCREYLGVECVHLGAIYRDELQSVALSSRIPIVRYKPGSLLSRAVYRIAEKLQASPPAEATGGGALPWASMAVEAEPLDEDAGFRGAEADAERDFASMRKDLEDLLRSGALSMADLVEAVRSQQVELAAARRENALLQARLKRAMREDSRA
jgi:flagellar biosynthesis protein FlhG